MLARDNNWMECAQVLREWVLNKDRDLREREMLSRDGAGAASGSGNVSYEQSMESFDPTSTRRRLHVKHSIDTALNILKAASSNTDVSLRPNPLTHASASPPPSPFKPFGEYPLNPDGNHSGSPVDGQSRRPSLPHIHPPTTPTELTRSKNATLPSPMQRRPRSAGTNADRSREDGTHTLPYGRGGQGRKLATKISLLFNKKSQQDTPSDHQNASNSAPTTHPTPTPASASATTLPIAASCSSKGQSVGKDKSHDHNGQFGRQRGHASSDASVRPHRIVPQLQPPSASFLDLDNSAPPSPMRPPLPSAVDLHNALAQQGRGRSKSNATSASNISSTDLSSPDANPSPIYGSFTLPSALRSHDMLRQRSGSASSRVMDLETNNSSNLSLLQGVVSDDGKAVTRPGILRGHHRTGSSGHASTPVRALRFDSTSSAERSRKEPNLTTSPVSIHARLHTTASSSSLRNVVAAQSSPQDVSPPASARQFQPPSRDNFDAEDEEQDYGQQLPSSRLAPVIDEDGEELHPPSALLLRQRGMSVGSSSDTSLSPIYINDNGQGSGPTPLSSEFPFAGPPPSRLMMQMPMSPDSQLSVPELDRRGRGDSLSSTSTADSSNTPQYSTSGSIVGSGATSVFVVTPAGDDDFPLPSTTQVLNSKEEDVDYVRELGSGRRQGLLEVPASPPLAQTPTRSLNERRSQSPLDIDIGSISSHAQAEALVARTRQDILELASVQDQGLSTASTTGPTPLSAKLAALGESLALERKLREQEQLGVSGAEHNITPSPLGPQFPNLTSIGRNGVERQLSLEAKARPKIKTRPKDVRRPSTADGREYMQTSSSPHAHTDTMSLVTTRTPSNSFFPGEPSRHQASLSVSPPSFGPSSSSSYDRREFFSVPHQRSAVAAPSPISSQRSYEPLTAPPVLKTRLRKELDGEALSRVSSAEGMETETESTGLAPPRAPSTPANIRKKETGRTSSSAKKLTRMGFTATDQSVARAAQPPGKLFGGFKSIMQTLKGKS